MLLGIKQNCSDDTFQFLKAGIGKNKTIIFVVSIFIGIIEIRYQSNLLFHLKEETTDEKFFFHFSSSKMVYGVGMLTNYDLLLSIEEFFSHSFL